MPHDTYTILSGDSHPILSSRTDTDDWSVITLSLGPSYNGVTLHLSPEAANEVISRLTEQLTPAEVTG